jgi:hypothetical protein
MRTPDSFPATLEVCSDCVTYSQTAKTDSSWTEEQSRRYRLTFRWHARPWFALVVHPCTTDSCTHAACLQSAEPRFRKTPCPLCCTTLAGNRYRIGAI